MKTESYTQTANYKLIANLKNYVKQDEAKLLALRDAFGIRLPELMKQRAIRRLQKRLKGYYIILATLPKM